MRWHRLALPNSLEKVHDVFHVSQLQRYYAVTSHILDREPLELDASLSYSEQPVRILVTILWSNHEREAATRETEASMREKYPHLFQVSHVTGT